MGIIALSDVPRCSCEVTGFYDRYRPKIAYIQTVSQRNSLLSDMQEDFERHIVAYPEERNEYSEIYQLLKRKCMEAI